MSQHKYHLLVCYNQVQIDVFFRNIVPDINPSLPSRLREIEVAYGFFNEMIYVVAYRGSYFCKYLEYETVLRLQLAYSVVRHLT